MNLSPSKSPLPSKQHAANPRYARQHVLREFGLVGQEKLAASRVLIVGVGGLGSPAAMYLAAAGIGTIGLVDSDVVEESNLHRQLLFGVHDIGANKLSAARDRLSDINPLVNVVLHNAKLTTENAREIIVAYDIVLDGTDNFPTRYAINDACISLGIPFVYGSVARFEGQVSVFAAQNGPCYRCLFPSLPDEGTVPSCAEDGVLGVLPGIVGLHQSTEVIKWLTGIGRLLIGRLLMLDLLDHSTNEISIQRDPNCQACGTGSRSNASTTQRQSTMNEPAPELDVTSLKARLNNGENITLLDVREPWESAIASLPNATLIPLSTLPNARSTLDCTREYVVYCHHGMRSAMAANWLKSQGFEHVSNMTGGIDMWSAIVDPSVPQY
ncbi:MAG: molybdopterin-synthase adenylyltransferase MoeB [Gemmatimonadaceae bacterium]